MLTFLLLAAAETLGADCYASPQDQSANSPQTSPSGQDKSSQPPDKPSPKIQDPDTETISGGNSLRMLFGKNLFSDQKSIWTSPAHIRLEDATWLVPFAGFTAGLIATDRETSLHLSNNPSTLRDYNRLSNYAAASLLAGTGGLYLLGQMTHDDHKRETAMLAGEAALDSLGATYALKAAFDRERPAQDNHDGNFWSGGNSFPSEHAAAAWSIAGVLTHEYPGPLTKLLAYGAATAVTIARVRAKQHFPSDVVVGSAAGWLIAEEVYLGHHDTNLGGGPWEAPASRFFSDRPYQPRNMGSPHVPMDSWVYPALDRLAALGYAKTEMEGMRPWTRMECARLIQEAEESVVQEQPNVPEVDGLFGALEKEFSGEIESLSGGNNLRAEVESVYTRTTTISGAPLRDGFDFGQTIVNDDGRPYGQGFNEVAGGSTWASDGPFFGYVRAEYQHAPSVPSLPESALLAIQQAQGDPLAPTSTATATVDRFDSLQAYGGMQLENWQVTFGKQELWWGPDRGGPMLFSTNAEPVEMLQIDRVTPLELPSVLKRVGPIRYDFFIGRLSGHHFVFQTGSGFTGTWAEPLADQPFIAGEKVSFKPLPNLEVGLGVTTMFAGAGVPFTTHKLIEVLFSLRRGPPGSPSDPGNRRTGLDFTYRIPKLQRWLTLYADGFTKDEPFPVSAFDKSAFDAGLYMPRLPKLPKLDFRVEGVYTDAPSGLPVLQNGFFYNDARYVNGYTNLGNLIGSWIGGKGQGAEAWSTYWFTPKNKLQLQFRHQKVSRDFIPQGGTLTDAGIYVDLWARSAFSFSGSVQYERWNFPVLAPMGQSNVTTSIQITFWPKSHEARTMRTAQPSGYNTNP